MNKLPIYKNDDKDFQLMQTNWASSINPVIANPVNNGILLRNVSLTTGHNVINTTLGRKLQGWVVCRLRASSNIYDTQDSNPIPNLTLWLESSANTTVDLYIF